VTDAGGLTGTLETPLLIDTRVPGTLTAPTAGSTLAGRPTFEFAPTAGLSGLTQVNVTLAAQPSVSFGIYNASADGVWRTTYPMGGLRQGPAELIWSVLWHDQSGQQHTYTAKPIEVAVDPVSMPLEASLDPATGTAPLTTTLNVKTSDPNGKALNLQVNWGDGANQQLTVNDPYDAVSLPHEFAAPGTYNVFVSVSNGVGGYASQTIPLIVGGKPNAAPVLEFDVTPTTGTAPLDVTANMNANDPEGDNLTYKVDFGDGTTPVTGNFPPEATRTHRYAQPGSYLVRATVTDGRLSTVRTSRVLAVLSEPLKANAGDDQTATIGDTVRFDGSGSRPDAVITRYTWDFGDGTTAEGVGTQHNYASPGTYTAKLTAYIGTQTDVDTALIHVNPVPVAPGLQVTVTAGGSVLAGATALLVASDGTRTSGLTGNDGMTRLQNLADGSYTIYAVKSGYLPSKATATISDGHGTVTVDLKAGDVATASVTTTPMTDQQIVDAGINPNDPANQNVIEFQIHLAFVPDATFQGYSNSAGFATCPTFEGISVTCSTDSGPPGGGGGGGSGVATFTYGGYDVQVTSQDSPQGQRQLIWMIIPGKAKWLKEFFDVQLMVTNLAVGDEFVIDQGSARLTVPDGLSLAPTSSPQSATVDFPAVPAGQSRTVDWFLRGDKEGHYPISASYTGVLQPFGETVALDAQSAKPIHVWGGSAFRLSVDADDRADVGYPYHVAVGITNVADVPMYNVSLELLKDGRKNYIYQPREQLTVSDDTIEPGETFSNDYILVPEISGTLDLADSFVSYSSGLKFSSYTITSHPQVDPPATAPKLSVYKYNNAVALKWEDVPGASDYRVYGTPNRDTDFPDQALNAQLFGTTTALVDNLADNSKGLYAISPIVGGRPAMWHPLTAPQSSDTYPAIDTTSRNCTPQGQADQLSFKAFDPVFPLTSYRVIDSASGAEVPTGPPDPSGSRAISLVGKDSIDYTVTVTNSVGKSSQAHLTWHRCRVFGMGDSFSSGEGGSQFSAETNEPPDNPDANTCHRSSRAYSRSVYRNTTGIPTYPEPETETEIELDPHDVNVKATGYRFVACSGAETKHIVAEGFKSEDKQIGQLHEFVKEKGEPDIITLSIGGNDAGFKAIIEQCLAIECSQDPLATAILNDIHDIFDDVADTLTAIQTESKSSEVYLLLYPDPVSPDTPDCLALDGSGLALGARMTGTERAWITHTMIPYLNDVVAAAGRKAGVHVAYDTATALAGHEICTSTPYANGIDLGGHDGVGFGNKSRSFHPNDDGQQALYDKLHGEYGDRFGAFPNPPTDRSVGAPPVTGAGAGVLATLADMTVQGLTAQGELGIPGSGLVVVGGTFAANSVVSATLHSTPIDLGSVTADANGNATFNVKLPDDIAAGMHYIEMHGVDANGNQHIGIATFYVTPPASPPQITSADPPTPAVLGTAYSFAFTASGSPTPTFALSGGGLPDGLTLSSDGKLSGTPTTAGTFMFSVRATNAAGGADAGPFTFEVRSVVEPPVFSSGAPPDKGVVGGKYEYAFTASGEPKFTVSDGALPDGLNLSETGLLSGSPSKAGEFTFSVTATNSAGSTVAGPFTIKVGEVPKFSSGAPPDKGVVGTKYEYGFTASGEPKFKVSDGALPDGLTLSETGLLSGTPSKAGEFTFSVSATNSAGSTVAGPFTIKVGEVPKFSSAAPPNEGVVDTKYEFRFTASGEPKFKVSDGPLPDGLTLSETGLLSGTPSKAGEFTFSVTATNSAGSTVAGPFTIKIREASPAKLEVTTQSLPGGVVGQSYRGSLAAIGGVTPYRWSVVAGTLPAGLSLDKSTGKLSGIPTAPGKSTVTFRVVDSTTPTAQTATVKASITIVRPLISLSPEELPVAEAGRAYKVILTADGGSGPYTFTLKDGSLPKGISLNSSGILAGTAKKAGVYWFRVQARDAFGNTGHRWFWIIVKR
jgi:PKD repeat protein